MGWLGKTNRVWGQQTAWGRRDRQVKGGDHHYQPTSVLPSIDDDDHVDDEVRGKDDNYAKTVQWLMLTTV